MGDHIHVYRGSISQHGVKGASVKDLMKLRSGALTFTITTHGEPDAFHATRFIEHEIFFNDEAAMEAWMGNMRECLSAVRSFIDSDPKSDDEKALAKPGQILWRGVWWSYEMQVDGGGPGLPQMHYPEITPEEVERAEHWLCYGSRTPQEWIEAATNTDEDFKELLALVMAEEDKR